jgi:fumarylacetoacetase
MPILDETHDPTLTSWVAAANAPRSDFPIQNLPLGVFRRAGTGEAFRGGVAIGDQIVDLAAVHAAGLFDGAAGTAIAAASGPTLNALMALGSAAASALRLALSRALRTGSATQAQLAACLVPQADAEHAVPANIGDYTDFYASIHHATNIGRLFRPDNPLLPNYQWIPIGYHGRSSSIGVSGDDVIRPIGQTRPAPGGEPGFGPSTRMDYELEVGVYVGQGNALGQAVPISQAEAHLFGISLLNDWSARDLQAWEYQPLGPFLAKSFASTVSPWIVTFDALAPFRTEWTRPPDHPQPLPYLDSAENRAAGGIAVQLEVLIETARMREAGAAPERLSLGNFKHAYWTVAQMLTHHTVNGCNMRPGDFFGSGTMSGPEPGSEGALIEITSGGKHPITLSNGETRTFLADGDTVIMRAWCERSGARRIGLGEVRSTVLPARG